MFVFIHVEISTSNMLKYLVEMCIMWKKGTKRTVTVFTVHLTRDKHGRTVFSVKASKLEFGQGVKSMSGTEVRQESDNDHWFL